MLFIFCPVTFSLLRAVSSICFHWPHAWRWNIRFKTVQNSSKQWWQTFLHSVSNLQKSSGAITGSFYNWENHQHHLPNFFFTTHFCPAHQSIWTNEACRNIWARYLLVKNYSRSWMSSLPATGQVRAIPAVTPFHLWLFSDQRGPWELISLLL